MSKGVAKKYFSYLKPKIIIQQHKHEREKSFQAWSQHNSSHGDDWLIISPCLLGSIAF